MAKVGKTQKTKTATRERVAVWLELPDLDALRALYTRVGVPVSESIRRAVAEHVKRLQK